MDKSKQVNVTNLPVHSNASTLTAFDFLPFLDCIRTLEAALFDGQRLEWKHDGSPLCAATWAQQETAYRYLPYVRGMLREFATSIVPLNAFLQTHGFDRMFDREFGPKEFGTVTISKRYVMYHDHGTVKAGNVAVPGLGKELMGFQLQPHQFHAWNIGGDSTQLLFEILTSAKSEDTLWVLPHDQPLSMDRLISTTVDAMRQPRKDVSGRFPQGIALPNIVFRAKPDLTPLVSSKVEYELPLGDLIRIVADARDAFADILSMDEVVKFLVIALTAVKQEFIHLRSRDGAASFTATGAAVVLGEASGPFVIAGPQASWFTPKYADVEAELAEELRNNAILAPFWSAPDEATWGLQFDMAAALKKWGGPDVEIPEELPSSKPVNPFAWSLDN